MNSGPREGAHYGAEITESCVRCRRLFALETMIAYRAGMWCLRCTLDTVERERGGPRTGTTGRLSPRFRPIRRESAGAHTE
ncbi:MAG: hypothetical protein IVW53_15360 [Chloroflexi bacterium]|nr:hypothetical protein [Chloroflexota bacterium]